MNLFGRGRARGLALLGRVSMYRLVLLSLTLLTGVAFGLSFTGTIVAKPLPLLLSVLVLTIGCIVTDVVGHRLIRRPLRLESGAITALLLVFVLAPTADPLGLVWLFVAAVAASASKYLIVWRGRHIVNPAAFGAAVVTVTGLTGSLWWVGTPTLAALVVLLGILVAWRADELGLVVVFLVVAAVLSYAQNAVVAQQFGIAFDPVSAVRTVVVSSPLLFFGFFMLTEPLTLPGRRRARIVVVLVAAVLVGWTISIGSFFVRPEVALLIANLVAFALAFRERRGLTLDLVGRRSVTPTVTELTLRPRAPLGALPGQYIELEVAHHLPDSRGTRREFSVMPVADSDDVRVAFRTPVTGAVSTYKQATADLAVGSVLHATGVRGDFAPPTDPSVPVVCVAAGIGVTPFVALLEDPNRPSDVVLVLTASNATELAYRDELAATGVPVLVCTPNEPANLPPHWRWNGGAPLDADALHALVPDLGRRHALISGAPAVIADLMPALRAARALTTDAFAGY